MVYELVILETLIYVFKLLVLVGVIALLIFLLTKLGKKAKKQNIAPPPAVGMYCPYCGTSILPEAKFCPKCGKSLQ